MAALLSSGLSVASNRNVSSMRVLLISFLKRAAALGPRMLAASLMESSHTPLLIFADCTELIGSNGTIRAFAEALIRLQPDIVGLSVYTNHVPLATELTRELKVIGGCHVVWGGPHPTAVPAECMESADFLCVGEAETSLVRLADALELRKHEATIEGVWSKHHSDIGHNGTCAVCADLDNLKGPAWHGLHQYRWQDGTLTALSAAQLSRSLDGKYDIVTGRGCPFGCTYCQSSLLRRRIRSSGVEVPFHRRRSPEHVVQELRDAKQAFPNLRVVNFWDDCFVMDIDYLRHFAKEYGKHIGLPFYCLSRFEFLSEEAVALLCGAGMVTIQIGVQTAAANSLRLYGRSQPALPEIRRVAKRLSAARIHTVYDVIFNSPFEDLHDTLDTVRFMLRIPVPFAVNGWSLVFLPGTTLEERAIQKGHIARDAERTLLHLLFTNINSPVIFPFRSRLPAGAYKCRYNAEEKRFANALLAMCGAWPRWLIVGLFYLRRVVPLRLLRSIWDHDMLVTKPEVRVETRRDQLAGVRDLVATGERRLALKVLNVVSKSRVVDEALRRECNLLRETCLAVGTRPNISDPGGRN